jgi:MFS family permease
MVLSRTCPSLWIPTLMVLWGTVVALTALVKTPAQLIDMRFVLGVTQAGFSPTVVFMISTWYCRHEQSKRFMCYLSAGILSGAFGGSIAGAIVGNLDGAHGVAGWQWCVLTLDNLRVWMLIFYRLFIVQGVATIVCAIPAPFLLLDYPSNARQLSAQEREITMARLHADFGSHDSLEHISHAKAFLNAVKNWRLWLLCGGNMTIVGC